MPKGNKEISTTAPGVLKMLWKEGFFNKTPKNQPEITKRLCDLGYNFSAATLGMALKDAKYLTRKGAKGSYKYVQKHPFIEEENEKEQL